MQWERKKSVLHSAVGVLPLNEVVRIEATEETLMLALCTPQRWARRGAVRLRELRVEFASVEELRGVLAGIKRLCPNAE